MHGLKKCTNLVVIVQHNTEWKCHNKNLKKVICRALCYYMFKIKQTDCSVVRHSLLKGTQKENEKEIKKKKMMTYAATK